MSIFRKWQVQTLSEWLEIATRKLSNASKQRIRLEIEAHYAEAVEKHREKGSSDLGAQAAALEELGDPEAAAIRFRREHLTAWEAKRLNQVDKTGRSVLFLLFKYLMFWVYTCGYVRRELMTALRDPTPYIALQIFLSIVIPTACFFFARWSKVKPNSHLVWMQALSDLGFSLFFFVMFLSMSATFAWALFWVIVCFLPHFLISLRVAMKVGRLQTTSAHIPPPARAQT